MKKYSLTYVNSYSNNSLSLCEDAFSDFIQSQNQKHEIDSYMKLTVNYANDFNCLEWRHINNNICLYYIKLAAQFFFIPASSSSSERRNYGEQNFGEQMLEI